jgi:hypothetical protein
MSRQCLDSLRRCVYLDKDLVLPPIGSTTATETFFVVASTDMQHSGTMAARIREHLARVPELAAKAKLTITATPVEFGPAVPNEALNEQVGRIAELVTGMVLRSMGRNARAATRHH